MAETGDTSPQRHHRGLMTLQRQESAGVSVTATETDVMDWMFTDGLRTIEVFLTETGGTGATVKVYSSPNGGTNEVQIGSSQTLSASSSLRLLISCPGRYTKITGITASGTATVKIWVTGRD